MITAEDKEIQSLVADVRDGKLLLPEMQRSYVWDSTQVRDFFDSLYHQYPSGQLLVWETDDLPYSRAPGIAGVGSADRRPRLLLDGQQRLTSLAAVMLGKPLRVRWRERPIDIVFNVFSEQFEVASAAHRTQARWVSLSKLFTQGAGPILRELQLDFGTPEGDLAYERLRALDNVRTYKYRVNVLEDLSYDEVTHIFVRINSGGTKLNSADLALAQISSRWRGVTEELDAFRLHVRDLGWDLDNNILVRVLTAIVSNQSRLSQLFRGGRQSLSIEELSAGWRRAKPALDQAIQFLIQNCGIDRLSMMPTYYVLVPLTVFFDRFGADVTVQQSRELQRWLYMALIWSRYTGATETNLDQDITALGKDKPIERMIQNIEDRVGRRPVTERELQDQLNNSPYMLLAYVLARRNTAQDWFNGVAIGARQPLEYHHIFPKRLLRERYDLRQDSRIVNQVANLAFLSAKANARILDTPPAEYLSHIEPARLRAQYVPLNPNLWALDRFEDFVLERRKALADAINQLLQSLTEQGSAWVGSEAQVLEARLNTLEEQIRELIAVRLTDERGMLAWKQCVPGEIQENVRQRLEQRIRRYPFEANQFDSLTAKLTLCLFSDYPRIIKHTWPVFQDVFGDKQRFEQHFAAVLDARNAFKHAREMNRSELAVAEGGLIWLEDCLRSAALLHDSDEPQSDDTKEDDTVAGGK